MHADSRTVSLRVLLGWGIAHTPPPPLPRASIVGDGLLGSVILCPVKSRLTTL